MAFSRKILSSDLLDEKALTSNMVGIGMNFTAAGTDSPNIEDTLLQASIEGVEQEDLRTLSILTTWLGVHFACINVDRLYHVVLNHPSIRLRAYWASVAKWLAKDRRFAKMANVYKGPAIELLSVGTAFQIQRFGEDPRFVGAPLQVPAHTLRDRKADVRTPSQLVLTHRAYRWRTIIGPSYRADMWAELEKNTETSVADLARRAYGSFATAWRVRKDWSVLHPRALSQ